MPAVIVDQCFDAFGREGAGALAAWMILTGNRDALNPILDSIRDLVAQLTVGHEDHHVAESTLSLVLNALGNSLLGPPIAEALGLPRDAARELAAATPAPSPRGRASARLTSHYARTRTAPYRCIGVTGGCASSSTSGRTKTSTAAGQPLTFCRRRCDRGHLGGDRARCSAIRTPGSSSSTPARPS